MDTSLLLQKSATLAVTTPDGSFGRLRLADLKYESTCAVQPPLWSDEDAKAADLSAAMRALVESVELQPSKQQT